MIRIACLTLALVAATLCSLVPAPAPAQDVMRSILRDYERRQREIIDPNRPVQASPAQPRRTRPPRASPFAMPAPAVVDTPKPVVVPTHFVRVLGDSLAELLADGLRTQFEDRPDVAITTQTRSSSGFVRDDFFDWNAAIETLAASAERLDAVVIMIGANDRQVLRDADGSHDPRSDDWRSAYVARIDAALAALKRKGLKTVWVGLPPMRNARLTDDVTWFNEIYRDRAERAGATYVDIWDGFVDADGVYTATGPDLSGQVTKLRTADGVHFSAAGAQLAAHFVERDLRRILGDAPLPAMPAVATSLAVPLAPSGAEPPREPGSAVSTVGPEAILPEAAPLPEKAEFGPVQPLDAVERSPGAVLLGGGQPTAIASTGPVPALPAAAGDPNVEKVLVRGEPLPPREGRADDFRWPRPVAGTGSIRRREAAAPVP